MREKGLCLAVIDTQPPEQGLKGVIAAGELRLVDQKLGFDADSSDTASGASMASTTCRTGHCAASGKAGDTPKATTPVLSIKVPKTASTGRRWCWISVVKRSMLVGCISGHAMA